MDPMAVEKALHHTLAATNSGVSATSFPSAAQRLNRRPSSEILYRLADNARNLRKARGYTQQKLANLCQLSKSYISNVEQATVNISLANLEAIATGLGCAEEDLLRVSIRPVPGSAMCMRLAKDPNR